MCHSRRKHFLVCLFFSFCATLLSNGDKNNEVRMNIPGYPEVFELNPGETHTIRRKTDQGIVRKQVRFSAVAEGESWGPDTFQFPIKEYHWRSASYNNTWSSLVPYNKLYYHRGEDYGAIPDKLDIQAPITGTVIQSPLPNGDGKSNALIIQNRQGFTVRIAHMNTETIHRGHAGQSYDSQGIRSVVYRSLRYR